MIKNGNRLISKAAHNNLKVAIAINVANGGRGIRRIPHLNRPAL